MNVGRVGRAGFMAVTLLVVLLTGLFAQPVGRVEVRRGATVTVGAGEVIDKDLIILATNATVDGTVNGDVVLAASQAQVNGTIRGRLLWAGRALTLGGKVGSSLYGAGLTLSLGPAASVEGDLGMVGGTLSAAPGSRVARNLAMGGNQAILSGAVLRNLRFTGRSLQVTGSVGGPPPAASPGPTGASGAETPPAPATAAPTLPAAAPETLSGLKVAASQATPTPSATPAPSGAQGPSPVLQWFIRWFRELITLLVLGGLALWLLPEAFAGAADWVRTRPLAATGLGFLVWLVGYALAALAALLLLIVGLILILATLGSLAAIVLGLGGAAYGLALGSLLLLVAYGSKLVAAYAVGRLVFERLVGSAREGRGWSLLIGVVIYLLLRAIPYFGWVVGLVATLVGLGAIWLAFRQWRYTRATIIQARRR